MPEERRKHRSLGEIRRFILAQLGEHAGGLTQGQLLRRFGPTYPGEKWWLVNEITAMLHGGRIMMRLAGLGNPLVYQQTPHGWLAWARAKQEEEETRGHDRGQRHVGAEDRAACSHP